jgi:UPF0042 nucleotide-binding protein
MKIEKPERPDPRPAAEAGRRAGRRAREVLIKGIPVAPGIAIGAVFDMRFLRNPHYDPALRPLTGRDAPVAAFVEADPDFGPFWARMTGLLDLLLPRYAAEGKKYLTVAIGCTGGKHRSVLVAERLAAHLAAGGWRSEVIHRELASAAAVGASLAGREALAPSP